QRGTVRQAMIGVECRPQVLVGAAPERRAVEILGPGLFRDEVDRAAGRPAPRVGGARALGHLDLLEREHVAGLRARIADAVDEHVRARIEAADLEVVTGRYAALARVERDPGDVPERLDQGGGTLFLDQLRGDDRDGFWGVDQRRRELARDDLGAVRVTFDDDLVRYVRRGVREGAGGQGEPDRGGERGATGGGTERRRCAGHGRDSVVLRK